MEPFAAQETLSAFAFDSKFFRVFFGGWKGEVGWGRLFRFFNLLQIYFVVVVVVVAKFRLAQSVKQASWDLWEWERQCPLCKDNHTGG